MLVQWTGLPPKETSWEESETLKVEYHLEDKVFFDEGGNVSRKEKDQLCTIPLTKNNNPRPRRKIIPPRHLADFI